MTISSRKYTIRALSFSVLLIFTLSLTGCLDNDPIEPAVVSYVALYHGAPKTAGVDIYYEDNKVTSTSFNYGAYSNYSTLDPGERTFGFSLFGTTPRVAEITATFEQNKSYTLFLAGETPETEIIMLTDTVSARVAGKAHLRVINLSPDAGEIDVLFGENLVTVNPLDFKEATAFQYVDNGMRVIQVRDSDTDEVLDVDIADNIQLYDGKYYTLIIRGYLTPPTENTNVLTGHVVSNN